MSQFSLLCCTKMPRAITLRSEHQLAVPQAVESKVREPAAQAFSSQGGSLDAMSPKGQGHSALFRMEVE